MRAAYTTSTTPCESCLLHLRPQLLAKDISLPYLYSTRQPNYHYNRQYWRPNHDHHFHIIVGITPQLAVLGTTATGGVNHCRAKRVTMSSLNECDIIELLQNILKDYDAKSWHKIVVLSHVLAASCSKHCNAMHTYKLS